MPNYLFLSQSYHCFEHEVFSSIEKNIPITDIDAEELLIEIDYFSQSSLDGDYYSPFRNGNSISSDFYEK